MRIKSLITLLRPHQYVKNSFVLAGVLFSHLWDWKNLSHALWSFIAFCLTASAVYILNDINDIESDRAHPVKCRRPLPSNTVSIKIAITLIIILLTIALIPTLFKKNWNLALILCVYLILNIFYSKGLKHIVLLDVFIIATGFMLRILAGTWGIDITPSAWLLLCAMMLTLFLGFCKRNSELLQSSASKDNFAKNSRKVLNYYNSTMLEQYTAITAACTIISFGLYTLSPQTIATQGTDKLIYTLPLVIYGIFRYLFLMYHYKLGSDTAKDLFTDKHMLLTGLIWTILTIGIIL